MPVKILYPLLEIVVFLIVFIYIPERIFRLISLLLKDRDKGKFFAFIRENVMGLLIGAAISFLALALLGDTLDNYLHRAFRTGFAAVQQVFGVDPVTVCVNRVRSEQRWTPDTFANEAAKFDNLGSSYWDERKRVLNEGYNIILWERNFRSLDELYDRSVQRHCRKAS